MAAIAAGAALLVAACGSSGSEPATTEEGPGTTASTAPADTVDLAQDDATDCPTEGEPFDTAMLYIEHNATDADTGVHGMFGGEAWRHLCIWDPEGTLILRVDPLAQFDDLAVADFFFESREPENDEVAIDEILGVFPEGDYLVGAAGFDGVDRVGTARFSHAIPVEPVITSPTLVEEPEETGDATVPTEGLVVTWEPVTETLSGEAPSVSAYEVIVTDEYTEDPDGRSKPVYDVIVGPDRTSLTVPAEFLRSGSVYELEVLVLEESGNQTIGLGFFATE